MYLEKKCIETYNPNFLINSSRKVFCTNTKNTFFFILYGFFEEKMKKNENIFYFFENCLKNSTKVGYNHQKKIKTHKDTLANAECGMCRNLQS